MRTFVTAFAMLFAMCVMAKPFIVVIDAGHGGHDPGAPGLNIKEKTVNLNVALKVGEALKKQHGNSIKVIFTRDKDFFVTLAGRADIANNAGADLFVSIHSNSVGDSRRKNLVHGSSVYVRGFSSSKHASDVASRENSVLELEDKTKINTSSEESVLSELVWNKHLERSIQCADLILTELVNTASRKRGAVEQNDLAVLRRTKMPAVLVELEYICNPEMEKFMASDNGQTLMANAISNGITQYRDALGGVVSVPKVDKQKADKPRSEKKKEVKKEKKHNDRRDKEANDNRVNESSATAQSGVPVYKVQFLTSPRKLAPKSDKLKGVAGYDYYLDGTTYKYTVGEYQSISEANKEMKRMRSIFPDAFVVKFIDGKRIK